MPDFDEPLKDYQGYFKDAHERHVNEYFEDLVRASGVNEQENIETVAELRVLEAGIAKDASTRKWWRFARVMSIIAIVVFVWLAIQLGSWNYLYLIPAVGALVFIFVKINPAVKSLNDEVKKLEGERDDKAKVAWKQMEPLNVLHTWEAARKLFMKTFPDVQLDSYFASSRLNDLRGNYGLSPKFNESRSVLFTQSGSLKNNPFVFVRYLQHWIGSMTYTGTLTIYWTERVRNAQGQMVTVQRSQVLTASVVKPYPEFQPRTTIVYGHEAAPKLSFSRTPSNLSGLDEGLMNNWRKEHAIKKVEKKARKDVKTGNGDLTVMSNREFEALFNATNRDNEIEFRLLFTPLAQQEMVNLMNDKEVAYGDDFAFSKSGTVNFVEPSHLASTRFDGDPTMFKSLELAQARAFFQQFHTEYFKSMYFGLAPLLTIPLYREARSMAMEGDHGNHESSFWEHEGMANYIGEANFKHPESITSNLLKTAAKSNGDSTATVSVTALGYKGIPRLDYVPMRGGDGNIHQVPVHWTEYIAVQKESQMVVGVVATEVENDAEVPKLQNTWAASLQKNGVSAENAIVRGVLAGALLRK